MNLKKVFIRLLVKGYGFALLFCLISISAGAALLMAPLFGGYIYHESHVAGSITAIVVPILIIVVAAIPTKRDRRMDL